MLTERYGTVDLARQQALSAPPWDNECVRVERHNLEHLRVDGVVGCQGFISVVGTWRCIRHHMYAIGSGGGYKSRCDVMGGETPVPETCMCGVMHVMTHAA